jgi:hypothetical protein
LNDRATRLRRKRRSERRVKLQRARKRTFGEGIGLRETASDLVDSYENFRIFIVFAGRGLELDKGTAHIAVGLSKYAT